jgi:hypothetical protein
MSWSYPARRRAPGWLLVSLALALLVGLGSFAALPATVVAHAAGIAVAELTQPLWEAPSVESAVLTELPAGAEMELTGHASGEFVEVVAGDLTGWVEVGMIHAGQIKTATTTALTPITAEPSADGRLLALVPAGDTVILTGAAVDEFLAGSYDGTGGWLPAANFE